MEDKEDESYIRQKGNIKSKTPDDVRDVLLAFFTFSIHVIAHKRFALTSIPVSSNL